MDDGTFWTLIDGRQERRSGPRRLPSDQRESFLHDYRAALDAAHETWRYRQLQAVLQLWHLRASAYGQPDYPQRAAEARVGAPGTFTAAEDAIPDWQRLSRRSRSARIRSRGVEQYRSDF